MIPDISTKIFVPGPVLLSELKISNPENFIRFMILTKILHQKAPIVTNFAYASKSFGHV